MIHFHGLPITPATAAREAISGGAAFVSFAEPSQIGLAIEVAQVFAVDNGAFSAWRAGRPVSDWRPFYEWVRDVRRYPGFLFAVIPDVIDGDESANDALIEEWPFTHPRDLAVGAPVWHLHESLDRLDRLIRRFPRVCFGSSGQFERVGSPEWEARMRDAMGVACCINGRPRAQFHGLRMLDPKVFSRFPFTSADSTNIGRNVGIDSKWKGTYQPPTKEARAAVMRARIESFNSPAAFDFGDQFAFEF